MATSAQLGRNCANKDGRILLHEWKLWTDMLAVLSARQHGLNPLVEATSGVEVRLSVHFYLIRYGNPVYVASTSNLNASTRMQLEQQEKARFRIGLPSRGFKYTKQKADGASSNLVFKKSNEGFVVKKLFQSSLVALLFSISSSAFARAVIFGGTSSDGKPKASFASSPTDTYDAIIAASFEMCKKNNLQNCQIKSAFEHCGALARNSSDWETTGVGKTKQEAEKMALDYCGALGKPGCAINQSICN